VVIGQLRQELLHELDDPVAGVSAAGTQPRLEDLLGVRAEGQQWVVGGGAALMGVVALRRTLLLPVDGLDTGVCIHPLLALNGNARTPSS